MLTPRQIIERLQIQRDYKTTFSTDSGKRVLAHLLKLSGATHPKFTTDADQLRWNEAQRHFAMSIFRQVHSSDQLPDYLVEELNRQEQEQKEQT